ncbi:MAG: alpha/beta hydrolase [Rhizobiaceae bacterium]|nr:alpha/beta hydrolase [Rhizobiaceae bacterium]
MIGLRAALIALVALFLNFPLTTHAQQSADQKPTRIVTKAVSVGGGLRLDIHAPATVKRQGFFKPGKKAPVLIYVHGGGWIKGTREKIYNLDTFATKRGWMLVSVQYTPVPRTNIDGQVRDIVRQINWVRNNISRYGGDKRKIVIMGHSAGSHLVSLIAAKRLGGPLRGVIANDVQAYDMVAYGGMRGSLPYVYAAAFGSNLSNWIKWSPVTYVRNGPSGGLPPFMIMYSGSNYERRKTLARGFAGDLRSKGSRVTLFDGRRYSHGSIARGIGKSPEVTRAVERFLRRAFR